MSSYIKYKVRYFIMSWIFDSVLTVVFVGSQAMIIKLLCVTGMVYLVGAGPAVTLEDLEVADDTLSVGSYVREARAAPPDNYHKSYQNEGDGEIGYSRKKTGGGKKGYQHFDSYHKKAGDNYEFEKQDSFGHDEGAQDGAYSHNHERKAKREREPESDSYEGEHRGRSERYQDPDSEDIDEHPNRKPAKEHHVKTRGHEELREGAADGNGGIEAYGHDPADYVLPEKYTYGEGEEYNF